MLVSMQEIDHLASGRPLSSQAVFESKSEYEVEHELTQFFMKCHKRGVISSCHIGREMCPKKLQKVEKRLKFLPISWKINQKLVEYEEFWYKVSVFIEY